MIRNCALSDNKLICFVAERCIKSEGRRKTALVFAALHPRPALFIAAETAKTFSCSNIPAGILHGGASVALAETLGSTGANLVVDRKQKLCVGLDINANHVRAMRTGQVTGTARPLHIGGSTQVWEIRITNDEEQLVCVARITMAVLNRASFQG